MNFNKMAVLFSIFLGIAGFLIFLWHRQLPVTSAFALELTGPGPSCDVYINDTFAGKTPLTLSNSDFRKHLQPIYTSTSWPPAASRSRFESSTPDFTWQVAIIDADPSKRIFDNTYLLREQPTGKSASVYSMTIRIEGPGNRYGVWGTGGIFSGPLITRGPEGFEKRSQAEVRSQFHLEPAPTP